MKDLKYYLEKTKNASLDGSYGINACKESIKQTLQINMKLNAHFNKKDYPESLEILLNHFIERANKDMFFNENMIRACHELIKEQENES